MTATIVFLVTVAAIVWILWSVFRKPAPDVDLCDCAASEPMPIEEKRPHVSAANYWKEQA